MITESQRQIRKLGIGGSDIAIILGLSTYKTPYQLYLEKTGLIEEDFEISAPQYWGHQLEAVVRDEFCKRNNVRVTHHDSMVHQKYDFIRGNIDGFIPEHNAVLEVKCSSSFMANEWGESGSDVIPIQYLLQVAHYCAVTDADFAHIAVLIGGNDYREFKYIRDLEIESKIIEACVEFWDCVQNRIPPDPINIDDLKLRFPVQVPLKTVLATNVISIELTKLVDIKNQIKALETSEEKCKFNLMQCMGDAESLVGSDGYPLATWKMNKKGSRTLLLKGV